MKNTFNNRKDVAIIFSKYTKALIAVISILAFTSCEKEEEILAIEEINSIDELTSKSNNYQEKNIVFNLDKAFISIQEMKNVADVAYDASYSLVKDFGINFPVDPDDDDDDTMTDNNRLISTKNLPLSNRQAELNFLRKQLEKLRNIRFNAVGQLRDAKTGIDNNPTKLAYKPEDRIKESMDVLLSQYNAIIRLQILIDSYTRLSTIQKQALNTIDFINDYVKPIYEFYSAFLDKNDGVWSSYLDADNSIEEVISLQYKIRPSSINFHILTRSGQRTRKLASSFYIRINNSVYGKSNLIDYRGKVNNSQIHKISLNSNGTLANGNKKHLYTIDLLFPRDTQLHIKQLQEGNRTRNITNTQTKWVHTPNIVVGFEIQINDNIIRN